MDNSVDSDAVTTTKDWQNRIVGWDVVAPDQLLANPHNYRTHPASQREALRASLNDLGWIAPVIVNRTTGYVVDGHARIEEALTRGVEVPIAYVELDEDEEKEALAILDPITGLASVDRDRLDALLTEVRTEEESLLRLLDTQRVEAGLVEKTDPMSEWQDMPEFASEDTLSQVRPLVVRFNTESDREDFGELIEQQLSPDTRYVYYPRQKKLAQSKLKWRGDEA